MSQVTFNTNVVTMEDGVLLPHENEKDHPNHHHHHHPGTPPTERSHDDCDTSDGVVSATAKENSQRSAGSGGSYYSSGSSGRLTAGSPHLRSNLTRQHKDRDPFTVYERVKLLGSGSMGSVSLVKKTAVGGSARYNAPARAAVEDKYEECFAMPILGGLFRWILAPRRQAALERASKSGDSFHFHSVNSSSTTNDDFFKSVDTLGTEDNTSSGMSSRQQQQYPLYAMKSIHYNLIADPTFVQELRNEIAVLRTLDHPHVIRVHETFDYQKELFVVMEVCNGGDLYTRDPYTEEQAARIAAAILSAVAYMHARGVIHRDLKFENCLFVNDSPTAEIKLIDFGLSKEIKEHEKLDEGAGTIYTMAPEVIKVRRRTTTTTTKWKTKLCLTWLCAYAYTRVLMIIIAGTPFLIPGRLR
eukprot:scaffold42723_cov214-Amphora_coffeaeformis.AAC.2